MTWPPCLDRADAGRIVAVGPGAGGHDPLRAGGDARDVSRPHHRHAWQSDRPAGRRSPTGPEHAPAGGVQRSEEHTSELQSLMRISYAVFCLKKKKKNKKHQNEP